MNWPVKAGVGTGVGANIGELRSNIPILVESRKIDVPEEVNFGQVFWLLSKIVVLGIQYCVKFWMAVLLIKFVVVVSSSRSGCVIALGVWD